MFFVQINPEQKIIAMKITHDFWVKYVKNDLTGISARHIIEIKN